MYSVRCRSEEAFYRGKKNEEKEREIERQLEKQRERDRERVREKQREREREREEKTKGRDKERDREKQSQRLLVYIPYLFKFSSQFFIFVSDSINFESKKFFINFIFFQAGCDAVWTKPMPSKADVRTYVHAR